MVFQMTYPECPPIPPPKDTIHKTSRSAPEVSDDGHSAESARLGSSAKPPRESFIINDNPEADIENGFSKRSKARSEERSKWRVLWSIMTIRPRKSHLSCEADEDEALLAGSNGNELVDSHSIGSHIPLKLHSWKALPIARKIQSIALYAMGILFIGFYIWMFSALFIYKKPSDPLANWGKPGTTSEGLSWYPTDFLRDTIPIPCHSHNDYWRKIPLFSALYAGCISVEADVWDFGKDILYVGHNEASLTVNRTFQSLYVNPLVEILERQNPKTPFYDGKSHGVFDTDHTQGLTLLVDVKTDGVKTWPKVLEQLQPLRDRGWLSFIENDVLHMRPITVVGTGETPFNLLIQNSTYRDAFFDAPLETMWKDVPMSESPSRPIPGNSSPFSRTDSMGPSPNLRDGGQGNSGTSKDDDYNPLNSYYASVSFTELIGRVWFGGLNAKQMHLLRGHIAGVHAKGLKARFWDTPAWPRSRREGIWRVLVEEGVDILNVDDLEAVQKGFW